MITRSTNLSDHIIAFCRFLREHHFATGTIEETDILRSILDEQILRHDESFALCLKSHLCKSRKQFVAFDDLYHSYWRELDRATDSKIKESEEEKQVNSQKKPPPIQEIKDWLYSGQNDDTHDIAKESAISATHTQNGLYTDERELKDIFYLVNQIIQKIANRRSRRYEHSHKRGPIDIRKSIRKNLLSHEEIIKLSHKVKKKNIKVVLLCDVSKSMDLYSRFFIQFMYAFKRLMSHSESFVFSTKLYHITEEIDSNSLSSSLDMIIQKVHDWGSGTRIGESLESFVNDYGHRCLNSKTVVFILSDGWDTGDSELISRHMSIIHRKAMKVIWLNPLMQNAEWKPEVLGMNSALPYIDLLLPLYNLDSIKKLVKANL